MRLSPPKAVPGQGLAERFCNLIVPSDTTSDGTKELHQAVMKLMMPPIGLITTADDVITHLRQAESHRKLEQEVQAFPA